MFTQIKLPLAFAIVLFKIFSLQRFNGSNQILGLEATFLHSGEGLQSLIKMIQLPVLERVNPHMNFEEISMDPRDQNDAFRRSYHKHCMAPRAVLQFISGNAKCSTSGGHYISPFIRREHDTQCGLLILDPLAGPSHLKSCSMLDIHSFDIHRQFQTTKAQLKLMWDDLKSLEDKGNGEFSTFQARATQNEQNVSDNGSLFWDGCISEEEVYTDELLRNAQGQHNIFIDPLVIKAFKHVEVSRNLQLRFSGHPHLVHCLETALLLAGAGADKIVVASGLLHDALNDTGLDELQIRVAFGDEVADLVLGVAKLSEFSQLACDSGIASRSVEADHFRNMLLATVDARVVLIKLAAMLHSMRTLNYLPAEKHWSIANETLEIFVPIALRLGIWKWKAEMEDHCFRYLKPKEYQELAMKLSECCREEVVLCALRKLDQALHEKGIEFHDISGRSKNLFSIHTKMKKKGRKIEDIYDVRGLRLIVESEDDCYAALNIVHGLWCHVKSKDYIKEPKTNGYQSLHTVVIVEDGLPLEVQIRTQEMHQHAEFGAAAHWRYKEGDRKYAPSVSERVEWARWVLNWHSEIMDTALRLSPSRVNLIPPSYCLTCHESLGDQNDTGPLFVIMLKGGEMIVLEVPTGCTVADLLTKERWNNVLYDVNIKPKLNNEIVNDVHQQLKMGDLIELPSSGVETMSLVSGSDQRERIRHMCRSGGCKSNVEALALEGIAVAILGV